MRTEFRRYKQGETEKIYKKLSPKNKEILDDFLKVCSITAGKGKLDKIRRQFIQLYDITGTDLNKQTKESIYHFLSVLNKSDRSIWTKNEIKCYLKRFLKMHYKELDLIDNIKGESRNIAQKINENILITEQDIEKMLRFAQNYKEKAYLFLIFESGARPQELINLKWQDIQFENDYANIILYSNKTRKTRTFPVKKSLKFLQDWKQNYSYPNIIPSDYVFVSRWRDKPMTSAGLNKILRRMAEKSNLKKDVWNYLFRHTRATKLYEDLPQQIVEKLMGHKNMAGVYAHISDKKAREMMLEKIYKLEELPEEKKHELEIEIENQNKRIDILEKALTQQTKATSGLMEEALKNPENFKKLVKNFMEK